MMKEDKLLQVGINSIWSSTLHHLDDLPYDPVEYLPHIYGKFREKNVQVKVRDILPTPCKDELPFLKNNKN